MQTAFRTSQGWTGNQTAIEEMLKQYQTYAEKRKEIDENTETWIKLRFVIFSALNTILILILHIIIDMGKSVFLITNALSKIEENSQKQ